MDDLKKELLADEINWASSQKPSKIVLSGKPKKKTETISFWNEAPLFQSSGGFDIEPEHVNKFVIERIEVLGYKAKALFGSKQVAIVEGIFSESEFAVGQRISVLPCLCCLKEEQCAKLNSKYKDIDETKSLMVFHINDENNAVLIEDDVLTVTAFCTAQECINNPLIKSLVADFSFDYGHPSLALGIIMHELIQSSFINKRCSFDFLANEAKRLIKENLVLLYSCNISDKEALNEVLKNMKNILKLINNGFSIQTVEHKVYSPFYGLKGSIDCLDTKYVVEIKTGKHMNIQHRSQAILYTILTMEQRLRKSFLDYSQFLCDISVLHEGENDSHVSLRKTETQDKSLLDSVKPEILSPLLFYVKTGDFVKIDLHHEEIVHLLRIRNDIACNKQISQCACPENFVCSILNKIKNLEPSHFLRQLYDDIELEANREKKYIRCTKQSQIRNKVVYKTKESLPVGDYCYIYTSNLKYVATGIVESFEDDKTTIDLCDTIETDNIAMICLDNDNNSLKYMRWSLVQIAYFKYLRKDCFGNGIDSFTLPGQSFGLDIERTDEFFGHSSISFDDIELNNLDFSDSNNKHDIQNDENLEISPKRNKSSDKIEVEGARNVSNSSDFIFSSSLETDISIFSSSPETARGILDIFDSDSSNSNLENSKLGSINSFNIDSNFSNKEAESKTSKPSTQSEIFSSSLNASFPVVSSLEKVKPKVLFNNFETTDSFPYFTASSKSSFPSFKYCIPEVFKVEFLKLNEDQRLALFSALNCESYRIIHGMPGTGKSTLIALLIRILIFYDQKVLLVCYTHLAIQNIINKVGSVHYYWAKKENLAFNSYDETVKAFTKPDLVAGTCYSFNDPIYLKKKFDYCIIDEGSQIHLLLALIPIHIAERFCMVGDHLQLKPLCKKAKVLSLSLFEHLIDKCSVLKHQYRMGNEIMKLSNTLFYDNQLIGFDGHSTVNFIDSDKINFHDFMKKVKNATVLCYFNAKVREIQKINSEICVTTIDRYQGSEADEIVLVFDPVEKCSVIESKERLNVGLTRARKKLTLLGSKQEMIQIELFKKLLDLVT